MSNEPKARREQLLREAIDVDEVVGRLLQLGHTALDSGDDELARDCFRAVAGILGFLADDA